MFDYISNHPYLTGTLAVGLVIVFFVFRRSSSSGTIATGSTGPSDAAIQSGNQLQMAQIAAQVQVAGYNASINAAQLGYAADVQKTQIAGNVALQNILSTADVTKYVTDAQLRLGLAQAGQSTPLPVASTSPAPVIYGVQQQQQIAVASQTQEQSTIQQVTPDTYNPNVDYSNYVGWLPGPGTMGRPSYSDLQASGQIKLCLPGPDQFACSQANTQVMNFYGI